MKISSPAANASGYQHSPRFGVGERSVPKTTVYETTRKSFLARRFDAERASIEEARLNGEGRYDERESPGAESSIIVFGGGGRGCSGIGCLAGY